MTHKTDMQAVLLDAMRVIAESADEIKAGCAIDDEWPDAEDKAEYDRRVSVLERVRALAGQSAGVPDGWKLVPIEPTPEMVKAGSTSGGLGMDFHEWMGRINLAWRHILAAAPAPVSEPAPYSAPFTTDVPHCCGELSTCKDPCGDSDFESDKPIPIVTYDDGARVILDSWTGGAHESGVFGEVALRFIDAHGVETVREYCAKIVEEAGAGEPKLSVLTEPQIEAINDAIATLDRRGWPIDEYFAKVFREMLAASAPTLGEIDWREKFFAEQRARMELEAALHLVVEDKPQPQAAEPKGLTHDARLLDLVKRVIGSGVARDGIFTASAYEIDRLSAEVRRIERESGK